MRPICGGYSFDQEALLSANDTGTRNSSILPLFNYMSQRNCNLLLPLVKEAPARMACFRRRILPLHDEMLDDLSKLPDIC